MCTHYRHSKHLRIDAIIKYKLFFIFKKILIGKYMTTPSLQQTLEWSIVCICYQKSTLGSHKLSYFWLYISYIFFMLLFDANVYVHCFLLLFVSDEYGCTYLKLLKHRQWGEPTMACGRSNLKVREIEQSRARSSCSCQLSLRKHEERGI